MANMIAAFFSKSKAADDIFAGCKIAENTEYDQYKNQYSVIHISFNDLPKRCNSYEKYIERIERRLVKDIRKEYPNVEISEEDAVWDILNEVYAQDMNYLMSGILFFIRSLLQSRIKKNTCFSCAIC